jgi:GT2 family glycosyltransferase
VVDNASSDDTVAIVRTRPEVQLIANLENRGFAAAANQGFAAASSEAVLLLNPDAQPIDGLDWMARAANHYGAAGGKLLSTGSDQRQQGFEFRSFPTPWTLAFEVLGINRLWPHNVLNRRYRYSKPRPDRSVDQPAGAFLMVHREAWLNLGGFDESFHPLWFEDVDFCKRLYAAGYSAVFESRASAYHLGAGSIRKINWNSRQLQWYVSLLKYGSKHFGWMGRSLVCAATMLACAPRAIATAISRKGAGPFWVYSKVFWLAGRMLLGLKASGFGVNRVGENSAPAYGSQQ